MQHRHYWSAKGEMKLDVKPALDEHKDIPA
jgi:hypothetical protein